MKVLELFAGTRSNGDLLPVWGQAPEANRHMDKSSEPVLFAALQAWRTLPRIRPTWRDNQEDEGTRNHHPQRWDAKPKRQQRKGENPRSTVQAHC